MQYLNIGRYDGLIQAVQEINVDGKLSLPFLNTRDKFSKYNKMKNEAENIDNQQGNGVLPCVSGSICCPLCGSINYEEYEELMYEKGMDDPQYGGELKLVKITDCRDCG